MRLGGRAFMGARWAGKPVIPHTRTDFHMVLLGTQQGACLGLTVCE